MIETILRDLATARGRAQADPANAAGIISGPVSNAMMRATATRDAAGNILEHARKVTEALDRHLNRGAYTVPQLDLAIAELQKIAEPAA